LAITFGRIIDARKCSGMSSKSKIPTRSRGPTNGRNPDKASAEPPLRWEPQIHPGWPVEKKRLGDAGRGNTIDPFALNGRIALVTGAGRGIGRAVAQRLAVLGAHVIITDINTDGAMETKAIIDDAGGAAEVRRLDVTSDAEVRDVSEAVIAAHGRIDILINNAGICINATALDTTDEIWGRPMRVNIDAVFRCSREFGGDRLKIGGARAKGVFFASVL
jgi:short chain dehydrogenase